MKKPGWANQEAFKKALEGLHPKLQEDIRQRTRQQARPMTEAELAYRGILKK